MRNSGKLKKEQILCIAAGLALAAGMYFSQKDQTVFIREGNAVYVQRPAPDEAEDSREILINGEKVSLSVSARKRTLQEAEALCDRLAEALPEQILAENEGTDPVTKDLELKTTYTGFPGVRVTWEQEASGVIDTKGKLCAEAVTEPVETSLCCRLSVECAEGKYERKLEIPVTVQPQEEGASAEGIRALLAKANEKDPEKERMALPLEENGLSLTYAEVADRTPLIFLFLGLVSAVLLGLRPKEEEKKRKKERENELLLDYSEVVSKLMIYTGAGLTTRNAFLKLASENDKTGRAVYRELQRTAADLNHGMPEGEAYTLFAGRCGPGCYMRLASLLERSIRTGGIAVRSELELEMGEAFEQRKNTAARLGEEAGTKMVVPLMMSLAAVLLVTAVPAILKMNG